MKVKNQLVRKGSGVVYHYTSLDTFMKLLDEIKYGYFKFWASDIFTMNDPTEFYHGFEKLWKLLPSIEDNLYKKIRNNPESFKIDVSSLDDQYRLSNFGKMNDSENDEWIPQYIDYLHKAYRTPFVISFSCQKDFLPMWSTYGDTGKGIALGLEIQSFYAKERMPDGRIILDFAKHNPVELHSLLVTYKAISIQHPLSIFISRYLCDYLQTIPQVSSSFENLTNSQLGALEKMFSLTSAFIKNKAYSYEEESRLLLDKLSHKDVMFRTGPNGKVIPYIHVGIPIGSLQEVIIGPCCDYEMVKLALVTRFRQVGISLNEENIIRSNIPYR